MSLAVTILCLFGDEARWCVASRGIRISDYSGFWRVMSLCIKASCSHYRGGSTSALGCPMKLSTPSGSPLRPNVICLSRGWLFRKGKLRRGWLSGKGVGDEEQVDLPHCWNSQDAYVPGLRYYRGYGSYRKAFLVGDPPGPGSRWYLESEGFYGTGELWLNGEKVSRIDGQYLGFSLDVTEHIRMGAENLLGVRLTNRCASHVLPGIAMPDFILYGGLSGAMMLRAVPAIHFKREPVHVGTELSGDSASIRISAELRNTTASSRRVAIEWQILDAGDVVIASTRSEETEIAPASSGELVTRLDVINPRLWNFDDPYLYRVRGSVVEGGENGDHAEARFGIRRAIFEPGKGFVLNGKSIKLLGCNRHESMPGFGSAMPDGLHRADARAIKQSGLNFVRLSHYPQHPVFLDACDELGILVYAEIASWKSVRTGRWLESAKRQMRDMIVRDRNHPSVILWGMGNEGRSRQAFIELRELAADHDGTRPVIYAENHFYRAVRKSTLGIPDLWGVNYELDVLPKARNAARLRNVVVSECANHPDSQRGQIDEEAIQLAGIESALSKIEGKDYVAGLLLWCFSDYGTLRKNRFRRYSGIMDAWRVPKMAVALTRTVGSRDPYVALFADWSIDGATTRKVHVLTNCGSVTLSIDGKPVTELKGKHHFAVDVEYRSVQLLAEASGSGGLASAALQPWDRAVAIHVMPDSEEAGLGDTVGLGITLCDKKGRIDRSWAGSLHVSIDGPAWARTYSEERVDEISGGLGRLFVTGTGKAGRAALSVSGGGLGAGEAAIGFR